MNRSHKRLALFAGVALVLIYVGWDMLTGIATQPAVGEVSREWPAPSATTVLETPAPVTVTEPPPDETRMTYAVALNELAGLAPTTMPGTELELWATWDPPVTKKPRLQKLIEGVILERIAPPVSADGPHVALLSVPRAQLDELLWGDRYGTLSAAALGTP